MQAKEHDAVLAVAAIDDSLIYMSFPMKNGQVDSSRSLGTIRAKLIKRNDSKVTWDGKIYTPTNVTVLYASGVRMIKNALAEFNIPGDDSAKNQSQILNMLKLNRAQVAALTENEAEAAIRNPLYKNDLKLIPIPLTSVFTYFGIQKQLYETDPSHFEALWNEINKSLRSTK